MGRRKKETIPEGQMDLIDVSPENLAAIKPIARKYKAAQRVRQKALEKEVELKGEVRDIVLKGVKEGKIKRLDDGSIKFKCDGMTIEITPRDELVKVKEEGDSEDTE